MHFVSNHALLITCVSLSPLSHPCLLLCCVAAGFYALYNLSMLQQLLGQLEPSMAAAGAQLQLQGPGQGRALLEHDQQPVPPAAAPSTAVSGSDTAVSGLHKSSSSSIGSIGSSNSNGGGNSGTGGGDNAQGGISLRDGDLALSKQQRTLRAVFYVFVSVQNLVGVSSLWARCADVFSPDAAARLFGFIAAGGCAWLCC